MGRLSDKELELIGKLRENLKDLDLDEEVINNANLIRWLHARNLDVKDAEEMFRNYIKWFDEMKLQLIFNLELPKSVTEGLQVVGFDHNQCPITLCALGQRDLVKLMKGGYKEQVLLQSIQNFEKAAYFVRTLMAERKESENLISVTTICDMEGFGLKQLASPDVIRYWIELVRILENFYPEATHKIIVINAPAAFKLLWNIVKPFLSQRTIDKFEMHGKDRQQWKEALLKSAPKESLPQKYGGVLSNDVDVLPKLPDCVPKKRGSY